MYAAVNFSEIVHLEEGYQSYIIEIYNKIIGANRAGSDLRQMARFYTCISIGEQWLLVTPLISAVKTTYPKVLLFFLLFIHPTCHPSLSDELHFPHRVGGFCSPKYYSARWWIIPLSTRHIMKYISIRGVEKC